MSDWCKHIIAFILRLGRRFYRFRSMFIDCAVKVINMMWIKIVCKYV